MKNLELNQMETTNGGADTKDVIGGIACGIALLWPIGTLIGGPSCALILIDEIAG